jgi:type IV secretion system protein VirB1
MSLRFNMKALSAAVGLLAAVPLWAQPFDKLVAQCASVSATLKSVVMTESSGNPYAIGVVGGHLARQPHTLPEALATVRELERQGLNFSMGLGQINRYNLARYGANDETIFDPCRNLNISSAILKDCFERTKARIQDDQQALQAALSCYYSGNFTRGLYSNKAGQPSYVQKVAAQSIPVVLKPAEEQWVVFASGPASSVMPSVKDHMQKNASFVQFVN